MTRTIWKLLLGGGLLVLSACSGADDFPCIPGTTECACLEGSVCDSADDVCVNGTCQTVTCAVGDPGCACDESYTCTKDEAGQWLACTGGLCTAAPCQEGALGCPCIGAGLCDIGLQCSNVSGAFRCEQPDCAPGAVGCSCFLDRTCGFDETGTQLVCDGGACVPKTCEPGTEGCVCQPNFGCDAGFICNDSQRCEEISCTSGTIGCRCTPGGNCLATNLTCDAGSCQEPGCPAGTAGCGCNADQSCNTAALVCESGRCQAPRCEVGDLGCACFNDGTCALGGSCEDGWCIESGCTAGALHCTCDNGACGTDQVCFANTVCVSNTGFAGGGCFENRSCRTGNRCEGGTCIACLPGTLACSCDDAGDCGPGVACLAGRCIAEEALNRAPPANAKCFTPCNADLVRSDGTLVPCSDEGLLAGCLEGTVCAEGSCVPAPELGSALFASELMGMASMTPTPPLCSSDLDCPRFQRCMQGLCFAECEADDECPAGLSCDMMVCRLPCTVGETECPSGTVCEPQKNSPTGFCVPHDDSVAQLRAQASAVMIRSESVGFSLVKDTGSFLIYNSGADPARLFVRKDFHSEFHEVPTDDRRVNRITEGGSCDNVSGEDCPLDWLRLGWTSGAGGEAPVNTLTLEITVPGGCESPVVACTTDADCGDGLLGNVCNADGICACGPGAPGTCESAAECTTRVELAGAGDFTDATIRAWTGRLEIEQPGVDLKSVDLTFRAGSQGRWVGPVVYYSNFEPTGIQDWIDGGRQDGDLNLVQNALVSQWGAFRRGDLDWDLFLAVLQATESESWRYPNVQARCDDAACFLNDRGEGIAVFSSSLNTQPIPTGAVELPMALNISPVGLGAVGKIDSSGALQYPGNPSVNLTFETDPGQCAPGYTNCVAFLNDFQSDIYIGGRYVTDQLDLGCNDRPDGTYKRLAFPWLVPGFAPPGYMGNIDVAPGTLYECRDTLVPVDPTTGDTTALEDANQRATAANPIPDAQTRQRTLELVDGALVDEDNLFILFRETFLSGGQSFSGYGYMRLQRAPATLPLDDSDGDGLADAFDGNDPPIPRADPPSVLGPECNPDILQEAIDTVASTGAPCDSGAGFAACIDAVANVLLFGRTVPGDININATNEEVHYLCHDTGLIDGGAGTGNPNIDILNEDTCTCRDGSCAQCQDDFATNFNPYAVVRNVERNPVDQACEYIVEDGICDDGGPGASSSLCAFGTDVSDCGSRTAADLQIECPPDSEVTFFTVRPSDVRANQAAIDDLDCQVVDGTLAAFGGTTQGTCAAQLDEWRSLGDVIVQEEPFWRCQQPGQTVCDFNRGDLRDGKDFFAEAVTDLPVTRLSADLDQAFRYKTQFLSRSGGQIGFVPEICSATPELRPYCYDPRLIQRAQQRVDCLLSLFTDNYEDFDPGLSTREDISQFLIESFSFASDPNDRFATTRDGFERLNAELLIMLGDEAFTRAFASRFDLAEINIASFDGEGFEGPQGINLSGVAGFEMVKLYQATQYYQVVLNRFFEVLPEFWTSIDYLTDAVPSNDTQNFVTLDTVATYLNRVVKASTQKARVWGEVAQRYQNFRQSPLARRVVERAYSAAYLESQVLAELLLAITNALSASDKPQVRLFMEQTQRRYNIALLNMREVYNGLNGSLNYFGFTDDFIPFPVLSDPAGTSIPTTSFEELLPVTRQKVQFAAGREDEALVSGRDFDTDAEAFQAEIANIRNSFDNQLGDLCGTFTVTDANGDEQVYPATQTFASLDPELARAGDPCGLVGIGTIHEAYLSLDEARLDIDRVLQAQRNNVNTIQQRLASMDRECDLIVGTADMVWQAQGTANSLRAGIRTTELIMDTAQEAYDVLNDTIQIVECDEDSAAFGDCIADGAYAALIGVAGAVTLGIRTAGRIVNLALESQIDFIDQRTAYFEAVGDCEMAQVRYRNEIFDLTMEMQLLNIDLQKTISAADRGLARLEQLRNQAKRLQNQREEALEMSINIAAAANDPNTRIFRNDAFFNADLAFYDALTSAYKLTKVYEYFTSQSYARLDELFLIRLVKRGDINLENYVVQLENAFLDFQDQFGAADIRVKVLSIRDDVLRIPNLENSLGRTQREVFQDFRQDLMSVTRLDTNGYTVLPFTTVLDSLSPLTRNHKVLYVEAELQGNPDKLGDDVGRVYLRQVGTGVVQAVDNDKVFFALPTRTAVVDSFVNGSRVFDSRVYRNYRLRDRPLVNTQWELVFNLVDEEENLDIDVAGLTDIVLYVYYTDFTVF